MKWFMDHIYHDICKYSGTDDTDKYVLNYMDEVDGKICVRHNYFNSTEPILL